MSEAAGLGDASLVADIILTAFERKQKVMERTQIALYKRLHKESEGIISDKAFGPAVADGAELTNVMKGLATQIELLNQKSKGLGAGLADGPRRAKGEVDPLNKSIRELGNSTAALRNITEATNKSDKEAIQGFIRKKEAALALTQGLSDTSTEYRQLTQIAAQAERSMATLEGRQTRLGFSANTLVGINRSLVGQLGQFGPLGNVAASGFDTFGGAMVGIPTLAGGVAAGVTGIAIATAALVKRGIPEVKAYQTAINTLAASGETNLGRFRGELDALQLTGGRAAKTFSDSQLAGALAETVKAGENADNALTLLRTSTQLASAENQDLGESTALVLQNLRQFQLGAQDASKAGDMLAQAGNLAAGTTKDLSVGLSTVGPVAKAANLSLAETLGLLVNLDNKGLSAAEEGATGLRSVLAALADPTAESRGVFRELNIELEDVEGNARPASEILYELKDALEGNEQAMSSAAKIFDSQGITTILALDDSTQQYTKSIENSQGMLRRYADEMANGLEPAQRRSEAAMADLSMTAANVFAPAITSSADAVAGLLRNIDSFLTGGAGSVSTILGIAKALGASSDKDSLLAAAEGLEQTLTGGAQDAVRGLIADLQEGKRPIEEISAALLELARTSALEPLERQVAEARAEVDRYTQNLAKARNQSPLVNRLTVGSVEENEQGLARAEESLRRAEGAVRATREQLAGMVSETEDVAGAAGNVEQAFADAQAQVANTIQELNFGSYNDAYIRLSVENPEQLLADVQTQIDNTKFEMDIKSTPELDAALTKWQELLSVVQQLVTAKQEAAAVPPPAPDAAPIDLAKASIDDLNKALDDWQKKLNAAGGGTEAEAAARAQVRAIEQELEARRTLVDANAEALKSTQDYAYGVSQSALQGITPFGDALRDLRAELREQESAQASLAQSGNFGEAYQLAADRAEVLRTAITEVQTAQQNAAGSASDFTTGLDQLNAKSLRAAEAQQRNVQAAKDYVAAQQAAANSAAPYDASGPTALSEALERAVKTSGYMTDAQREANLALRETEGSAESLSDVIAAGGAAAYEATRGQAALNRSFREAKQSAADYNTTTRLTETQTNALSKVFGNVRNGLKEAEAEYRRTGDAQAFAQTATGLYQDALTTLREQGFDALNPAVQEYLAKLSAVVIESGNAETASLRLADAAETLSSKFDSEGIDAYMRSLARQDIVTFAGNAKNAGEAMRFLSENGIVPTEYHLEVLNETFGETGIKAEVAKSKAEALADTFGNAVEIFSAVTEGAFALADALGVELPESFSIVAEGVEGLGGALQKALSGDIIGAITQAFTTLFNVIADGIEYANARLAESGDAVKKYGLDFLKENGYLKYEYGVGIVVDTAALAEYEQYLAAIEERGQAVADKYVTIDEQGRITFNEEAFAEAENGLDRLADTADRYREKLDEIKNAVDSVNEAELEAKQLTLDAKIEGQDGAYSVNDIMSQVDLDIADAAQKRDAAYSEAWELEQAGYKDLADRRRAAADQAYQAEISMIKEGAEDRAEAIGENNGQFQSALDQNAAQSEQKWQEYWNADTNAQIQAQARAREQLRRQEAVMNSQRYTDLLNAGYTEQEAYRLAAEGLGYQINQTTGDLVTAQEQAGVAQGQAAQNAGNTAATGITTGWQAAVGAVLSGGSSLNTTLASTQGVASSLIAGLFGNTGAAVATQGGALGSTFSTTYGNIIASVVTGASGLNTTLTNGANLNLGTISSVTNALGGAIVGGGNALARAELDKANQLIRQKQEGAKKEAQAEGGLGNELNKVVARVSDSKIAQVFAAGNAQSAATAKVFDFLVGQVIAGNKGLADAWSGKGTHWSSGSKPHWSSGMGDASTKLIQDAFKAIGGNFNADWAKPIDPEKFKEQQEKKLAGGKGGSGPGPKGSLSYIDSEIERLKALYDDETDKGKRADLARQIKALEKERKKIDVLAGGDGKGGSDGSGSGDKVGPKGSPSELQDRIRKLNEKIDMSSSLKDIRELQKKRDKLQAELDKLLGKDDKTKTDPKAPAGSINDLEDRLGKAREAYENMGDNVTDGEKAKAAERIKVLEAELKEKRKLLEDAAKGAQDAVKGTVISIESPIADLGTLAYLAKQVSTTASRLPSSVASASAAQATSITRLPESYTPNILPAYQEQMEASTVFKGSVQEFRLGVNEFRAAVREFRTFTRGNNSLLADEARNKGYSTSTMR